MPSILIKAIILALTVGMIAFCGQKLLGGKNSKDVVRIGYTAPDDGIIKLAISIVESMESMQDWCSLLPVDKEEGKQMVRNGELAALLVMPQNALEGILTGINEPASLYLSNDASLLGLVFEELAAAGVGMLQTAQAEIYATSALMNLYDSGWEKLEEMYAEINSYNLGIVLNREQYFQIKSLSPTGNTGFAVYYASAFFTIYLLLAGLFFGPYIKRSRLERLMLKNRKGIHTSAQLAGRIGVTMALLFAVLLLPSLFWLWGGMRQILQAVFTIKAVLLILLSLSCMAAWLQFVYSLADNHKTAVLLLGLSTVIMGYMSGCFIPSALLPRITEHIGAFLPSTYVKSAFTMLFSGQEAEFAYTAAALILCTIILCILGYVSESLSLQRGYSFIKSSKKIRKEPEIQSKPESVKKKQVNTKQTKTKHIKSVKSLNLFIILAKRLLLRKSYLLCLAITVILSFVAVNLERQSKTAVNVAIHTMDESLQVLFSDYEGLVNFIICSDPEEVKRNVVQQNAECGYVLQEDLQDTISAGGGNWSITVYEDADSTLTRVINEVVFERIFYSVSSDWFEGYIAENEIFYQVREQIGTEELKKEAAEVLQEKLTDGSTFSFERQTVKAAEDGTKRGVQGEALYPIRWIAGAGILLCGIMGITEALWDKKVGRFFKNQNKLAEVFTVILPVLGGVMMGLLICLLTGTFTFRNIGFLFGTALLITVIGLPLQWMLGKLLFRKGIGK